MTAGVSTEASRAAALTMFDIVPCWFQLAADCANPAAWMAYFVHEEPDGCQEPTQFPVCGEHKEIFRRIAIPFWRVWFAMQPMPCGNCRVPLRLDRFEPLGRQQDGPQ
jgi:hypothetical protein